MDRSLPIIFCKCTYNLRPFWNTYLFLISLIFSFSAFIATVFLLVSSYIFFLLLYSFCFVVYFLYLFYSYLNCLTYDSVVENTKFDLIPTITEKYRIRFWQWENNRILLLRILTLIQNWQYNIRYLINLFLQYLILRIFLLLS